MIDLGNVMTKGEGNMKLEMAIKFLGRMLEDQQAGVDHFYSLFSRDLLTDHENHELSEARGFIRGLNIAVDLMKKVTT